MELENCLSKKSFGSHHLIVDLASLHPNDEVDGLVESLRNILLILLGKNDSCEMPSLIITLIWDDKLDIVLDARPLKKQMWNQISASLDKIKTSVRKLKHSLPEELNAKSSLGLEESLEKAVRDKTIMPQLQVLVITRREDDVMHALTLTLDWPKDMLPIKLLTPNHTSDRYSTSSLRVTRLASSFDLDMFLKQSMLKEHTSRYDLSLELTSRGSKETILLDVHRRSVNLEFTNSSLIPGEGEVKLSSLKGIRVVKESGLCESVLCGDMYFLSPTACRQLDLIQHQENGRNFGMLLHSLEGRAGCLIVESARNLYVLRPLAGNLLGLRRLSTVETILPVPEVTGSSSIAGTAKLMNIMNDLPEDEMFNPLQYKSNVLPRLEAWISKPETESMKVTEFSRPAFDFVQSGYSIEQKRSKMTNSSSSDWIDRTLGTRGGRGQSRGNSTRGRGVQKGRGRKNPIL